MMKNLSNFFNIDECGIAFFDISKYLPRTCTLFQSHRLAWFLELTDVNLRASGVE